MIQKIVLFDFDGTLSRGEAGLRFARFLYTPVQYIAFLALFFIPILFYKARIYDEEILEIFVRFFLKGKKKSDIVEMGELYAEQVIPKNLIPEVFQRLLEHREKGDYIVIVSRSLGVYLRPWAARNGIDDVIATELEENEGVLTGAFIKRSCEGEEKVRRIKEAYQGIDFAYGNDDADIPMLKLAKKAYMIRNGEIIDYV